VIAVMLGSTTGMYAEETIRTSMFQVVSIMSTTGLDIVSAVSSVIACQFNIGPGLGAVGPMSNYGELAPFAKWVLSFCMIAGRLEFYTLLILLTGVFWSC
jgi:trk system potassium uptake protein TrkH